MILVKVSFQPPLLFKIFSVPAFYTLQTDSHIYAIPCREICWNVYLMFVNLIKKKLYGLKYIVVGLLPVCLLASQLTKTRAYSSSMKFFVCLSYV